MRDLASNLNFQGPPRNLIEILKASVDDFLHYPDPDHNKIKDFCAEHFNVDRSALEFGSGATEIIFTLARMLSQRPVLILSPSFWEYEEANRRAGNFDINFLELSPEEDFKVDLAEFEDRLPEGGVVYICQPNNPTSQTIPADQLREIVAGHPETDFVIDETYLFFLPEYEQDSLLRFAAENVSNTFVVQSFSKFFAIPGVRIGMLATSPERQEEYQLSRDIFTTNALMPTALQEALSSTDFIRRSRELYKQRITEVVEEALRDLDSDHYRLVPPQGPFVLIELLDDTKARALVETVHGSNLAVRDCSDMRGLGTRWIRTAIQPISHTNLLFRILNESINQN